MEDKEWFAQRAQELDALVIVLGPYRNLSTLTATALAFHPNVQVLNHAAPRLLDGNDDIDFVARPDPQVYRRFLATALAASEDGARGQHGGSIVHSHAFDDPAVPALYRERFRKDRLKAQPTVLVWKDSMVLQRRLAESADTLATVIERLPDVRFLLPVRQPLYSALSNRRTGHFRFFMQASTPTLEEVLDALLATLVWVLEQRDRWPERFMAFTERRDARELSADLARYLGVTADTQWIADFAAVFRVRPGLAVPPAIKAMEQRKVAAALSRWPDIRDGLLQ